jgi:type IV secretion system protein VirB5
MFFKRPVQRYGKTPEVETPYKKARQSWDDRIGSAVVQAANWRFIAFGSLALSFVLASGAIWESSQSRVVPYVVEVDKLGAVQAVGPAIRQYNPSDAQIAHFLGDYIYQIRSLSIDPVVVVHNWNVAWNDSTDHGKAFLSEYARTNDPSKSINKRAVEVEVTSIVRASANSFEVKWTENVAEQGSVAHAEHWTAIVTYVVAPPSDDVKLKANPLGLYVDGINWSREVTADEKGG